MLFWLSRTTLCFECMPSTSSKMPASLPSRKDADEAIAILEKRTDITLLFTDIQMPGSMDGLKLAHAVRDRWPPIKIVVVSGQTALTQNDLPANSFFSASRSTVSR
jgi:CheY-like chemotaxis protein